MSVWRQGWSLISSAAQQPVHPIYQQYKRCVPCSSENIDTRLALGWELIAREFSSSCSPSLTSFFFSRSWWGQTFARRREERLTWWWFFVFVAWERRFSADTAVLKPDENERWQDPDPRVTSNIRSLCVLRALGLSDSNPHSQTDTAGKRLWADRGIIPPSLIDIAAHITLGWNTCGKRMKRVSRLWFDFVFSWLFPKSGQFLL